MSFLNPNIERRGPTRARSFLYGVMLIVAIGVDCDSSHALHDADGASPPGTDGTPAGQIPDGSTAGQGPEAGCPAPGPLTPCRIDSDCRNPFLACERPSGGVFSCRDPEATADLACPSLVDLSNIPICPTTAPVTYAVCTISYQRPCSVESDCGPAGFVCEGGRCQGSQSVMACTSATECPTGWDCYAPCPCPTADAGTPTKVCEPPFAAFGCPACPASQD
jgi:hypothetical protein